MNVIVTGGTGFVGTNLIKRLLKDGYKVVSLDNYSTGLKENEQDGCQYFDVDLCEVKDYSLFMSNVDVIYHIGALARIQPSLTRPIHHIKNNVDSTLNVLEFARNEKIPVVYAGSSSKHHGLYGSPYAWSKWMGEEICKLYNQCYDVPMAICRFYNVYGPHQLEDGPYCTVVGVFQNQVRDNQSLTITSDGEQRRDFTHVDDIVDGLIKCGDGLLGEGSSVVNGEEFELGRGVNFSINEVADMFGEDYPREYLPLRKGEYDKTLCTDTKAKELLGWNPTRNLNDYMKEFVETERFLNE
jgi:UDP-glucose 4-epimerase